MSIYIQTHFNHAFSFFSNTLRVDGCILLHHSLPCGLAELNAMKDFAAAFLVWYEHKTCVY